MWPQSKGMRGMYYVRVIGVLHDTVKKADRIVGYGYFISPSTVYMVELHSGIALNSCV